MTRIRLALAIPLALLACAGASKEVRARRALGDELVKRHEWAGAFAVVDRLCRDDPRDAHALTLRGTIYTEQRLLAEAEADLTEAVRLAPRMARAHAALGILHDLQGRPADALVHHRRAVELAPRDPGYLNNLGFSLFASGRPREAVPVLHEALRWAPVEPRIRNNLGFAYAAAGELASAAQQFELAGSRSQARNNLGFAYERRGARPQAYDLYLEALRLDPASRVARENLLRVAGELGRELPGDVVQGGAPLLTR